MPSTKPGGAQPPTSVMFHRELTEKRYAYNRPDLEELPWELQIQVYDPFGYRIRFCQ